jgi:aminoglycoside phosphotransferase (APT) family kinase protein
VLRQVHDLALDNVLIDRDGSLSLIDCSGGDLGDPRYDLSLALATDPEILFGEPEIAAFFEGYGSTRTDPVTTRWFRNLYEFF